MSVANIGPSFSPPARQSYPPVLPAVTNGIGSSVTIGQASPPPQLYGQQLSWPLAPPQLASTSDHSSSKFLWVTLGLTAASALALLGYFALKKNGWLRTPVLSGDATQSAEQTTNAARTPPAQPNIGKPALSAPQSSEQTPSERPEHAWTKLLEWKTMPEPIRDFLSKERTDIENSSADLWDKRMAMWDTLILPSNPAISDHYHGKIVDACFPFHSSSLKNRRDVEFSLAKKQHYLRVLTSQKSNQAKQEEFDQLYLRMNIPGHYSLPDSSKINNIINNIRKEANELEQVLYLDTLNLTSAQKNNELNEFFKNEFFKNNEKAYKLAPAEYDAIHRDQAAQHFPLK